MCRKSALVHFVWSFHIFAKPKSVLIVYDGCKEFILVDYARKKCRLLSIILGHVPRA